MLIFFILIRLTIKQLNNFLNKKVLNIYEYNY